jgi:transposase-like protein
MSHNGTRRHFSPQEKVAILRRHLLENVPVSQLCDEVQIEVDPIVWTKKGHSLATRCQAS